MKALTLLPALSLTASAFAQTTTGHVYGQVTDQTTGQSLAGVTVELLEDGVWVVGSTQTDASGDFSLHHAAGTYDLRVRSGRDGLGYIADLEADIVLGGSSMQLDFALLSIDQAWLDRGLSPTIALDSDNDFLPDFYEAQLGTSPWSMDSNGDGVFDGIAVFAGADPMTGPAPTSDAPEIYAPADGSEVQLATSGAHAPLGLFFRPVQGATGYRLSLQASDGSTAFEADLDYEAGALLLGEKAAVCVPLPIGLASDTYTLRLQGYYGDISSPVGGETSLSVQAIQQASSPVVMAVSGTLSGTIVCESFAVLPGVELSVPKGEQVTIVAGAGGVHIGEGASIRGAKGASPGEITILSRGDVVVAGELSAGAGKKSAAALLQGASGQDALAVAAAGHDGGDLTVFSMGQVAVTRTGRVASGDGGRGGRAEATGGSSTLPTEDGGQAEARGGDGGRGGDLLIATQDLRFAYRPGILHCGNGGIGGRANAQGGSGGPGARGGGALMFSGVGGESGDALLSNWDALADGYPSLGQAEDPVSGGEGGQTGAGSGGDAGDSTESEGGTSLECGCSSDKDGANMGYDIDGNPLTAKDGKAGWRRGGAGGDMRSRAQPGVGCGDGGQASARGGDGGSIKEKSINVIGNAFTWNPNITTNGGWGGTGLARGGDGGEEGGNGGAAQGVGGDGGNARSGIPSAPTMDLGGPGGSGMAFAGDGGTGYFCCGMNPDQAGDGGEGGVAIAIAGDGGDAIYGAGSGGIATAEGGDGGDGGDGCPPGAGGTGGTGTATAGSEGDDDLGFGSGPGAKIEKDGTDGEDGADCCLDDDSVDDH